MRLSIWAFLLLLMANAANAGDSVAPKVKSATIFGTDLKVVFDLPMQTWDGKAQIENIRLSPAADCEWTWSNDVSLSCSTYGKTESFKPATYYRLTMGSGFLSQEGAPLDPVTVDLNSPGPVIGARIIEWKKNLPEIQITSNLPVSAEALGEKLEVFADASQVPYRLVKLAAENKYNLNTVSYRLEFDAKNAIGSLLTVKMKPGLQSMIGPVPGVQNGLLLHAVIDEPFKLDQYVCSINSQTQKAISPGDAMVATKCDPVKPITLSFSRKLSNESLERIQATLPAGVGIGPSQYGNYYYHYFDKENPAKPQRFNYELISKKADSQFSLSIPDGVVSIDGERLIVPPMIRFEIGDYAPTLEIKPAVMVQLPGEQALPTVNAMNIEIKSAELSQLVIGRKIKEKRSRVKFAHPKNQVFNPVLPKTEEKIRENGGIIFSGSDDLHSLVFGAAYAPFNVLVGTYRESEFLVWVTQWESAQAIAGARVEVLRLDLKRKLHLLAEGKTDALGVSVIHLAKTAGKSDDLMTLVRVTTSESVVVTPVSHHSTLDFEEEHYGSSEFPVADEEYIFSFGVTELPLYRPGESVNYRLWTRQKIANHFQMVADKKEMRLQLSDIRNRKSLQSWDAESDANGSVSGKLELSRLLPDGFYCITPEGDSEDRHKASGACFQVARFEAQPLWAKLEADRESVMPGQTIGFKLESGFFSGGPAANVNLDFSSLGTPKLIEETYPEFSDYRFIYPYQDGHRNTGSRPLADISLPEQTDANGKAAFSLPIKTPLLSDDDETEIPFGVLEFSADAMIPGKASASSGSIAVNYSRYPKFVGLKTKAWWLQQNQDPGLEAVVVSHDGKAINGEAVNVDIYRLLKDDKEEYAGRCQLVAGSASPCDFRTREAGKYLFKATNKDAAPAELTRYIGNPAQAKDEEKASASLVLVKASDGQSAARILLVQPFDSANVLFALEYNGVVDYWVQSVSNKQTEIDIPVKADWSPGLNVRVTIRPAANASDAAAIKIGTLGAILDIEIPKIAEAPLSVITARKGYKPGEEIELEISNPGKQERSVTISVLDDSVYQQGRDVWRYQDPNAGHWLDVLDNWESSSWFGLEGWNGLDNIFKTASPKIKRIVEEEGAQPVQVLTRADIERTGLNNVFEILGNVGKKPGSGLSVIPDDNEAKEIDAVNVVGSKIRRAVEIFERSPATNMILARRHTANGKPMPRVRSQFVDAAYWNPDVVLAPGETTKLKFKLPDNLTQWRVLTWASDSADGFALSQTTFETSLPIEVRAGLPGQLFVGDSSNAQITARNQSDVTALIKLNTALTGAGIALAKVDSGVVKPYAALEQSLAFSPAEAGSLDLLSIADSTSQTDGLSSGTTVQSRYGEMRVPQTGWLDSKQLNLSIPELPESAIDSKVDLKVSRGFDSWTDGWLKDLKEYPHRCWEQTLSRAVGAAYADAYDENTDWSDRKTTVNDALQVASSFQDEEGYYRYFQSEKERWERWDSDPNYVLSAYTLKSYKYLQNLGYPVSKKRMEELQELLPEDLIHGTTMDKNGEPNVPWETSATIAGVIEKPEQLDMIALASLWLHWDKLSWFARSEFVQAIARKPEFSEQTKQGIQRLREAGEQLGLRQVIGESRDFSYYMGSNLRDQCGVVSALYKLDKSEEGRPARERLLRGVYDLYAGGTASLDTQSSAQCLMALHDITEANRGNKEDANIEVALGAKAQTVNFAADRREANWQSPLANTDRKLSIASDNNADGTMNYSAVISYQYDLQQTEARGTGLDLQRHYDVLRNGKWVPLLANSLRESDWVRVRLIVSAPAARHFVAVSDFAPGGLVTRDITLSSVGGADVKNIGGNGSYHFDSRQTGSSVVRIYAEYLPAGQHEIFYYAQAVHPGDYFAPPAIAELMYGRASRANTTSDRVVVRPAR